MTVEDLMPPPSGAPGFPPASTRSGAFFELLAVDGSIVATPKKVDADAAKDAAATSMALRSPTSLARQFSAESAVGGGGVRVRVEAAGGSRARGDEVLPACAAGGGHNANALKGAASRPSTAAARAFRGGAARPSQRTSAALLASAARCPRCGLERRRRRRRR